MRKVQFGKLLLFALFAILVSQNYSCNQKKEAKTEAKKITGKMSFGKSRIPCFSLSYQDLDIWEKNNLLSSIDHVLFLSDRDADPSTITLTLYPFDSNDQILNDGILKLSPDNSCNGIDDYVLLAENYISLSAMGIVQAGKFGKFKSIRLQPYARATDNALGFNYSVEDAQAPLEVVLNPCPPCVYCIPRCPPEDTTDSGDSTLKVGK